MTSAQPLSGQRILVIGGAGFIGSHVVEALLASDPKEIIIFDDFSRGRMANLETALRDKRVKLFGESSHLLHTDVLNTAMAGIDVVFHLAALWLLHCQDFPRAAFDVNIQGTFNVLEACVANQVKKLVYSSSASVYGDALSTPMTEAHPFNNRTFYGATKIAGEQMCTAFHHRYGLAFAGLRYMNVYGARQDDRGAYTNVIVKTLDRIERNQRPVIFGDGAQSYDFIYVEDVARANVLAAQSSAQNDFYNIGTGVQTSIAQLVDTLLELTGSPPEAGLPA